MKVGSVRGPAGILTFGVKFLGYPRTLLVLCWWGLESYLCDACVSKGIRSIWWVAGSRSRANHRVSLLLVCNSLGIRALCLFCVGGGSKATFVMRVFPQVSAPFGGLRVHDLLQITGYPYLWCAIPRVSAHSACFALVGARKLPL